jgi:hypothetical protein
MSFTYSPSVLFMRTLSGPACVTRLEVTRVTFILPASQQFSCSVIPTVGVNFTDLNSSPLYIKIQLVPHRKHVTSSLQTTGG